MAADTRNNGKISTITAEHGGNDGPASLEKAILTTGYGTFNALLLLAALPVAWAGIFDTTTGAFIIASAKCDLQLTFFRNGVLVAFPYVAMTLTTFLWDHVTPYVGMRNLFVLAVLGDSILNLLSTAVDSYYVFLLLKFLTGVLAGGPLSMVMIYLSEFHSVKYKPGFTRWAGLVVLLANIVPAAIGFMVLPQPWKLDVFGKQYPSWRIYLLICSIVPIIGLITAAMLPESPKHLMEIGRHEDALKLLRTMYVMNTRNPADTFPIKALLVRENAQVSQPFFKSNFEKIRQGWYNTKLLFSTTYLPAVEFLVFLQFGSMLGFNTLRLWVPHTFIVLNNFDAERWTMDRAPTICEMMDPRAATPARDYLTCPRFHDICFEWKINMIIYINSTIIATSAVLFSFLAAFVTTTKSKKRIILGTAFLISVVSSFGINWAQSPLYMLTLASAIIVTTRIAGNIVTAVNVDVIPIPLRATSLSVLTTVGNIGAVVGNFMFSALLELDCLVAFLGLGCLFAACFSVSFFIPSPVKPPSKNPDDLET